MSTPTSPDHTVILELGLEDLRHIIESLLNYANYPHLNLEGLDANARMIDLLIQLERDIIHRVNQDMEEEQRVREFGEI